MFTSLVRCCFIFTRQRLTAHKGLVYGHRAHIRPFLWLMHAFSSVLAPLVGVIFNGQSPRVIGESREVNIAASK